VHATDYFTVFDLLNAANYGVPQQRERVLFIGTRDGRRVTMPAPTHGPRDQTGLLPWRTLEQALAGLEEEDPVYALIPPKWREYMKLVPAGGNWRALPVEMQSEALGAAYRSWGGRSGFYRRLAWDKPTPALTTKPVSKATMLCHPDKLRPLSIREYMRIQQFPDDWQFEGGKEQQYVQLGNAVPIGMGSACGRAILRAATSRDGSMPKGKISTSGRTLDRLLNGARTRLNPTRMRQIKDLESAKRWLAGRHSGRRYVLASVLEYLVEDDDDDNVSKPERRCEFAA
jgi:DNA (cytosine-5)-methyltransferase 1